LKEKEIADKIGRYENHIFTKEFMKKIHKDFANLTEEEKVECEQLLDQLQTLIFSKQTKTQLIIMALQTIMMHIAITDWSLIFDKDE